MTFMEAVEAHKKLTGDRAMLHSQHEQTYSLDPVIVALQKAMLSALAKEQGEEDPEIAALRRRVETLERAARTYTRPDGKTEDLGSDWAVAARLRQDAKELTELRVEVAQLRARQLPPLPVPEDPLPAFDEPTPASPPPPEPVAF